MNNRILSTAFPIANSESNPNPNPNSNAHAHARAIAISVAIAVAIGSSFLGHPARAQPAGAATPAAATKAATDDRLYQSLGGESGIKHLTDDFFARLLADSRMNPFFKEVDAKVFKTQLGTQLCEVSGGPCRFKGKDMKTVHSGQDIRKADFNALVEVLQQSMDAQGIAFSDQNRLLAKLAPMHRDIVNAP